MLFLSYNKDIMLGHTPLFLALLYFSCPVVLGLRTVESISHDSNINKDKHNIHVLTMYKKCNTMYLRSK